MKRIIYIISVFILFTSALYGQTERYKDKAEISTPVNVDCDIHAYKKVVLKSGFKIKSGSNVRISLINKEKRGTQTSNKSLVKEFAAIQPVKYIDDFGTMADNAQISVSYSDNFGNIEQTHVLNTTPDGKDLISFGEFNPGSTTKRDFIGFASNTNGTYINNVEQEQRNFYNGSNSGVAANAQPWSTTTLEDSPDRRVLRVTGVGSEMSDKSISTDYKFNTESDIPKWDLDSDTWIFNGYYDQGTHIVTETIDENGKQTTTVTNSMGQTVLTKSGNIENWYVYDYLGRLVHNIPSAAVQAIKAQGAGFRLEQSNNIVKEYVYTYKYVEGIPGVAEKFLPGIKGSVEYVYDRLNRVVLSRNVRLKGAGKWSFIKYDKLGRVIITGTYKAKGNNTRVALQELLLQDDKPLFEQYESTGDNKDYSSNAFPSVKFTNNVESIQIDVCNYYDEYVLSGVSFDLRSEYDNYSQVTKGMLTAKKVRIEGGVKAGTYSKSAFYYNNKGQLISTVSTSIFDENILNRTYIKYNFVGKAEKSLSLYNRKLKSGGFNTMQISQFHTYDRVGRLLKVDQQINGDANGRVTMATYEYNTFGQLKTKNLHKKADGNFLQTVDYAYNIRGQLTDINSVDDKNSDDVFAMRINYNKQLAGSEATAKSLYNGFISSVEWRSGEGKKQAYAFEYDDNYRLTTAKYAAGDNLNEDVGRFNMSAEYDNMGNITRMQRNGGANGALIDDLTYNYTADNGVVSNRLHSVADASTNNMDNQYGFGKPEGKFWYDDLGNLIADSSREVYSIEYNDQNLPIRVVLFNGKEISYVYTAEGTKLTRVVYDPYTMKSIYTRYEGGFVYETDLATNKLDLKYFAHSQGGRVVVNDNKFSYEYFLSDHLGNVRATIGSDESGNLALLQTTDYYPFGLTMANGNKANADQPYQYGGKEWQNNTQVYDFHARQYNPALGRWFNPDPLMEKYAGVSSYNYCLNNPVNIVDPTGLLPERPWDWNENVDGEWGSVSSLRRAGYDYLSAYRMAVVDSYLDGGGGYYERHNVLPVFSSTEAVLGHLLSLGFTIEESIVVHYEGMAATLFAKLLNNTSAKAVRYGEGGLSIFTKNVYNTQIDPRDPFRTYKSDGDLAIAAALGIGIVTVVENNFSHINKVKGVVQKRTKWCAFAIGEMVYLRYGIDTGDQTSMANEYYKLNGIKLNSNTPADVSSYFSRYFASSNNYQAKSWLDIVNAVKANTAIIAGKKGNPIGHAIYIYGVSCFNGENIVHYWDPAKISGGHKQDNLKDFVNSVFFVYIINDPY